MTIDAVVITAAGSSSRMGSGTKKEFQMIGSQTVLEKVVRTFIETKNFQAIVITIPEGKETQARKALGFFSSNPLIHFTAGGNSRQESVHKGLEYLKSRFPETRTVLIHDGARPFITHKVIQETLEKSLKYGAAVPVVPSVNAMKSLNEDGTIAEHLLRQTTVSAQTPQGFNLDQILKAHRLASEQKIEVIDDTELYSIFIGKVHTVPGSVENIKITYSSDMEKIK